MPDASKVYLTRAGKSGQDEDRALENGVAIIGFQEVPSLAGAKNLATVQSLVESSMPNAKPARVSNFARQLWAFASTIEKGDIVVLPRKLTSQVAIGRVTGRYRYQKIDGEQRHTLPVEWVRPDAPRTAFEQDMLHSLGAFMTVCRISRHDAERRVAAVMSGKKDPGMGGSVSKSKQADVAPQADEIDEAVDLAQRAHDQIVAHIQTRFAGHGLATLVEAVLRADGWVTTLSSPGPDGGVDILGGRGPLGLDDPRVCVQVKSEAGPVDVTVYRTLQGTMQSFKASQGLLVCWGGFKKSVIAEARQSHFSVRLWDSGDLVEAIYRTYDRLPAEIQAELPLKRTWMLVAEDTE